MEKTKDANLQKQFQVELKRVRTELKNLRKEQIHIRLYLKAKKQERKYTYHSKSVVERRLEELNRNYKRKVKTAKKER